MREVWYAHTKGESVRDWQTLPDHLDQTAALAGIFAEPFNMKEWAELCGLLHDAGKYTEAFQQRLMKSHLKVDHSTEGGRVALERFGTLPGKMLAYVILGHHGHLPNAGNEQQESSLQKRLNNYTKPKSEFLNQRALPALPKPPMLDPEQAGFQFSLIIRMLFSCLVDADCLDTEAFGSADQSQLRPEISKEAERAKLTHCLSSLNNKLDSIIREAKSTSMNLHRAIVLEACRAASSQEPGLFSLTVPTGGGKTLASMAFALEHALKHDQRRVIYVAPFTSIIEQTAQVYRGVFGDGYVLEHHSAIEDAPLLYNNEANTSGLYRSSSAAALCAGMEETDEDDGSSLYEMERQRTIRLITENWSSPIVVTTAVQFLESLFASKKWRCRKLHNIAGSVVILDEAQTLPDQLLLPTLAALETLCKQYGCTVLLCTATQPALDGYWSQDIIPREIIPDRDSLYENLRRTRVHKLGTLSINEAAERLRKHPQALFVVSMRGRARDLYNLLKDQQNVYHLSARMCAAHRTNTLNKVRALLSVGKPCLVISTQLIEAGVDIDFAVVYRELGGIDAIAQAAGRCNREGRRDIGDVYVYEPAEKLPK